MLKQLQELLMFTRVRLWYKKYERLLLPGAIIFGLIGDFITVRFINLSAVQIILSVHVLLIGLWIIIIHSKTEGVEDKGVYKYVRLLAPLGLYYSFGAMFSMFLVLYSNSGSLFSGGPFLFIILLLLIGTEVYKKEFKKLLVQVVVYFCAIISYFILVVPYVIREIGSLVFFGSGVVSLFFVWGFLLLLKKVSFVEKEKEKNLYMSIGGVFLLINILYFTNSIPPFPLSLRDVGVYQTVSRSSGGVYLATRHERSFIDTISPVDTVYIGTSQSTLFAYSSIFAPIKLSADVVHEWKRFSEGRFRTMSRIEYPISGGRDAGYRGYTYTTNITPGLWWVTVETKAGKVIGGTMFRVVRIDQLPPSVIDQF
jgi:hypothetical protein